MQHFSSQHTGFLSHVFPSVAVAQARRAADRTPAAGLLFQGQESGNSYATPRRRHKNKSSHESHTDAAVPVAPNGLSSGDSSREPASAHFSFRHPELEPRRRRVPIRWSSRFRHDSAQPLQHRWGVPGAHTQERVGGVLLASQVMLCQMHSPP